MSNLYSYTYTLSLDGQAGFVVTCDARFAIAGVIGLGLGFSSSDGVVANGPLPVFMPALGEYPANGNSTGSWRPTRGIVAALPGCLIPESVLAEIGESVTVVANNQPVGLIIVSPSPFAPRIQVVGY